MNNLIRTTQTKEGPQVEADLAAVGPLFENFFQSLTQDQRTQLISGVVDTATKILVADLLLNIISVMTKAFSVAFRCSDTFEQSVDACVKDAITHSLTEALELSDKSGFESSTQLSELIHEEVEESVSSALSANSLSLEEPAFYSPQQT